MLDIAGRRVMLTGMVPADLHHMAIRHIESAEVGFLEGDETGAQTAALISIACSLALLTRPPTRARASTYGEYDHDAAVTDREEIWAEHDRHELRDARD